jgi:hypothetical protein
MLASPVKTSPLYPLFRDDAAHRFRDDLAHRSENDRGGNEDLGAAALVGVHIGAQPGRNVPAVLFRGACCPPLRYRALFLMRIGANVPPSR